MNVTAWCVLAAVPPLGWAAVSHAPGSPVARVAVAVVVFFAVAVSPPFLSWRWRSMTVGALGWWAALVMAWWPGHVVPAGLPWRVWSVSSLVWWAPLLWHAAARAVAWTRARLDRDDDGPEPDDETPEPDPEPVGPAVRAGLAPEFAAPGIEVGWDDPDADPVPPPERRVSVQWACPPLVRPFDPEPPAPEDPAVVLAGRIVEAWDGDAAVMHLDELADRMGVEKDLLRLDLDEAGVPVEPRARKKRGQQNVPKLGVRRTTFDEWREALEARSTV